MFQKAADAPQGSEAVDSKRLIISTSLRRAAAAANVQFKLCVSQLLQSSSSRADIYFFFSLPLAFQTLTAIKTLPLASFLRGAYKQRMKSTVALSSCTWKLKKFMALNQPQGLLTCSLTALTKIMSNEAWKQKINSSVYLTHCSCILDFIWVCLKSLLISLLFLADFVEKCKVAVGMD